MFGLLGPVLDGNPRRWNIPGASHSRDIGVRGPLR
jgi:hypothetical protein